MVQVKNAIKVNQESIDEIRNFTQNIVYPDIIALEDFVFSSCR